MVLSTVSTVVVFFICISRYKKTVTFIAFPVAPSLTHHACNCIYIPQITEIMGMR